MTTEDDFNAVLDKNPEDWQTRLVFADWLQERGDVRADGYRALAVGRNRTDTTTSKEDVKIAFHWWCRDFVLSKYGPSYHHVWVPVSIPTDWFELIDEGTATGDRRDYATRRAAEDAAARAFAKLPAPRRAELLAAPPPVFEVDYPPKPKRTKRRKK